MDGVGDGIHISIHRFCCSRLEMFCLNNICDLFGYCCEYLFFWLLHSVQLHHVTSINDQPLVAWQIRLVQHFLKSFIMAFS